MSNEPNATVEATVDAQAIEPTDGKATEIAEATPEPAQETEAEREAKAESRLEKRFSKLTKQRYQAEARAELLERELQAMRSKSEPQANADDATDIDSIVERKLAERQQREEAEKFQSKSERLLEKALEECDMELDDFIPLPRGAADAIVELENPKIVAYLQKNPEEIERLSELSYQRQAVEIGKLEAKLSIPAVVKKSGAPAPISPISGAKSKNDGFREDMTQVEYEEWRNRTSKHG